MPKMKDTTGETIGGLAFFVSFTALALIGLGNVVFLVFHFQIDGLRRLSVFILGALCGAFVARHFIKHTVSVLVHEWKHRILSNLVGNKEKSFRVDKNSGHFEYSYSKHTARYNAFIALAPYWLPLASFFAALIGAALFLHNIYGLAAVLGIGFGIDFIMNTRDISPHQTDFSTIRGGYRMGLCYVVAINIAVSSLILVWVLNGGIGFVQLGQAWWKGLLAIVSLVRTPRA